MALTQVFERILNRFPKKHLRLVFAYGSGVFQQEGHKDMSKNMIDFTFAVDDPVEWHRENMKSNSSHYSFLKHFGPKYISRIQSKYGAKVYFNTLVPCEGRVIKYGVISTQDLTNDLLDWESLYVSGRLHKPVNVLRHEERPDLLSALIVNHQSAVHAALLLEGGIFTEEEFYATITSLSYTGDFRMTIGEDKNKILNIVRPNIERFRMIYEPILMQDKHVHFNKSQGVIEQSTDFASRFHHVNLLPKMVLNNVVAHCNKDGRFRDTEEVIHDVAHDADCSEIIQEGISAIVKKSSTSQSIKGIFTAGVIKSVRYSYAKLQKMWKSKRKT